MRYVVVDSLALAVLGIIAISLALSFMKRFELAIVLVLCNIVVFLLQMISGPDLIDSWHSLAFSPEYLQTGENLYTIVTSMFSHASIPHLLGNMIFLILLGPAFEARVGKKWFAASYFIGGIVATLFFSAQMWGEYTLLIGASGAISGIIGSFLIAYPRNRITMIVGFLILPNVPVWIVTAAWFAFDVVLSVGSSSVAWQAHLGGFLAGMIIGLLIRRSVPKEGTTKKLPPLKSLEELATNKQQMEALNALENETNPDIINAWMEHFAENTPCPNCGSHMQWIRGEFRCNCGYTRKVK